MKLFNKLTSIFKAPTPNVVGVAFAMNYASKFNQIPMAELVEEMKDFKTVFIGPRNMFDLFYKQVMTDENGNLVRADAKIWIINDAMYNKLESACTKRIKDTKSEGLTHEQVLEVLLKMKD